MEMTDLEVKEALDSMTPLKALGIDGLHAKIFQSQWNIVSPSVCRVVKDAFVSQPLNPSLNATLLVLLSKVNHPEAFPQFRPISLCSVLHKIIMKTLVNKLKLIMLKLKSPNQVSFVSSSSILDNIIIAQKAIHMTRTSKDRIA
ncbi:hypothetical protein PVK06_035299 [Gossypium arboreum]|uniref:Reverse transcriptase domain-containing protein n=1 Tax=Gossypium arboreum TaxID=29729 RepID=A0ABR0NGF9_GOSAR|nr:hypothetical protein PVK06_035299 [Gossypium arboreum]